MANGTALQLLIELATRAQPEVPRSAPHRGIPDVQHWPPCRLNRGSGQRVVGSPMSGLPVPLRHQRQDIHQVRDSAVPVTATWLMHCVSMIGQTLRAEGDAHKRPHAGRQAAGAHLVPRGQRLALLPQLRWVIRSLGRGEVLYWRRHPDERRQLCLSGCSRTSPHGRAASKLISTFTRLQGAFALNPERSRAATCWKAGGAALHRHAHLVLCNVLRDRADMVQVLLRPELRVEVQPEVEHHEVSGEAPAVHFDQRRQHVLRDLGPVVRPDLREPKVLCPSLLGRSPQLRTAGCLS